MAGTLVVATLAVVTLAAFELGGALCFSPDWILSSFLTMTVAYAPIVSDVFLNLYHTQVTMYALEVELL